MTPPPLRTPAGPAATGPSPLMKVLLSPRPLYARAAWYSFITGMLFLLPQWYMFEVYGRVLDSRNHTTLAMLVVMVLGIYVVMELLELVRARVLARAANQVDEELRGPAFDIAFDAGMRRVPGGSAQIFSDLRTIREFISSPAVTAIVDLPAALVYVVLLGIVSPWLGLIAFGGMLLQALIAYSTERRTMPLLTEAGKISISAQSFATSTLRNAQVIESMGMLGAVRKRWLARHSSFLARQSDASDYAGTNATAAKLLQMMQGSVLLGAACWVMLNFGLVGGGGMVIVASILGGRALQPLAQLVAQWRLVVNVRDSYKRLNVLLAAHVPTPRGMPLPRPTGMLTAEAVVAGAPGSPAAILRGVSFALRPGEMAVVVGPSGAGKTTLARVLVGIWPTMGGRVRLDGADVYNWHKDELGPHVGYMPQTGELFDGTLAENIARFGDVDLERVKAAAELVGLHATIDQLPQGYDTRIGEEGAVLSGGQRQRVALARAVYGDPALLVLDEPNANLDEAGDADLLRALQQLKARGATVVVISHRTAVLPAADKLLVLNEGTVAAFGPRDEVLAALKKANEAAQQSVAAAPRPPAARLQTPMLGGKV